MFSVSHIEPEVEIQNLQTSSYFSDSLTCKKAKLAPLQQCVVWQPVNSGHADCGTTMGTLFRLSSLKSRGSWSHPEPMEVDKPVSEFSAGATTLADLGEDLLLHILHAADSTVADRCRFACVNRAWKRLCYSKVFWKKLRMGHGSIKEGAESIAPRCSSLVELHIDDPRCELHILHPIIVAAGGTLRRVIIDCDKDRTSRNEASICSILWIISLYCKRVECVELVSDGRQGAFGYLENKAMWYLTSGFRTMKSFTCLCQDSVTKQSIYLIVIAWRELTSLQIHCGGLAMDDLMALKKCYTLRQLEIVGCKPGFVSSQPWDVVMHHELESITFRASLVQPEDVALLVRLCPSLRCVVIKQWHCPSEPLDRRISRLYGLLALRDRLRSRSVELGL
eukprot:jgi/Mesen1/1329/ME000013S00822